MPSKYYISTADARRHTEAFLGGVLLDGDAGLACLERYRLRPEMFTQPCVGKLFAAALALRGRKVPVSLDNLRDALSGEVLAAGQENLDVLIGLMESATSRVAVPHHAQFLRECYYRDVEKALCADLARAIQAGDLEAEERLKTDLKRIERERAEETVELTLQRHSAFMDAPHEPPPPVIEGLFNRGEVVMLASDSKAGKSWFLLQAATCIGGGLPFLGHKTTPGTVLYLNFEVSEGAWWSRCRAQSEAMGIQVGGPAGETEEARALRLAGGPSLYHACARGLPLTTDNVIPLVRGAMEKQGLDDVNLIIFDPFYTLAVQIDENAAGEVAGVMLAFQRMAESMRASILVCHHYAKGNSAGKKVLDRSSGSGAFGRSVDTSLNLTQLKDGNNCYRFEVVRRNAKSPPPVVVRFEYPLWRVVEGEEIPPEEEAKTGRPNKWTTASVTARMEPGKWYSRADLLRAGVARHCVTSLLQECEQDGFVVKDEAKGLYRLANLEDLV